MARITPFVYLFSAPACGLIKVGYTSEIKRRLYHLRWGNLAPYVPLEAKNGRYIMLIGCVDVPLAQRTERQIQEVLAAYRIEPSRTSGGKPEWFRIDEDAAILAVDENILPLADFSPVIGPDECREYFDCDNRSH